MRFQKENLIIPTEMMSRELYERASYSIWTVSELLNKIFTQPLKSVDSIIDEFALEMMLFAEMNHEKEASLKFRVAGDVMEEIMLFLAK